MKSSIVRTLVTLSLSAALSPVALMAQGKIQVTIPFDFTVGDKSFPVGDYTVAESPTNVLVIRNVRDNSAILTLTMPADTSTKGNPVLIFNRYGNSYFLSKVSTLD